MASDKEEALELAASRGAYTLADRTAAEANQLDAKAFADYLLSPAAQEAIRALDVDHDDEPDFFPDAGRPEPKS